MHYRILSVCFFVFSLLPVACPQGKQITLQNIYRDNFFAVRSVQGLQSMKDGEHYTTLEDEKYIVKYAYRTGTPVDTLFALPVEGAYALEDIYQYELSDDEQSLLLASNIQPIYRHSFYADYHVWNMATRQLTPVSEQGLQQLATFSPDGKHIAIVRSNNLYIKAIDGDEVAITQDGEYNAIIHGVPDWVYEEEFGFSKAFAWSPDSRYIA